MFKHFRANGVVENDVAPALQATKNELERQLKADTIAKHLRRRPSKEELIEEGVLQDASSDEEEPVPAEKPTSTLSKRSRYAIALKSASRLARDGLIDMNERGRLKDLILSDDGRITAAIECFELDNDAGEVRALRFNRFISLRYDRCLIHCTALLSWLKLLNLFSIFLL